MEKYTKNWLHKQNLDKYLKHYINKPNIKFLEIGCFEGLTTNYLVDNFLTGENSRITCVDPWIKYSDACVADMGKQYDSFINEGVYDIFVNNTQRNKNKIEIFRGFSSDILPTLEQEYDFIYIDGDHSEKAVWIDAINSFNICKDGAIIIFDDYKWNSGDRSPKKAIDRFIIQYKDKIQLLEKNRQVIIKKNKRK